MNDDREIDAKPIPNGFGYLATSTGRIWSPHSKRIICDGSTPRGYAMVILCDGLGARRGATVHRLVAMAWIPNPHNLPQINHINGNRRDNRPENLEWCTGSQNMLHAWREGLQPLTERMREVARQKAHKINARNKQQREMERGHA